MSVAIVPGSSTLAAGETQQFAATVTGISNSALTWQVNGVTGGNSIVSTITTGGTYQAPTAAPTSAINVDALPNADGISFGSAPVTVAAAGAPAISVITNPTGVTVVYTAFSRYFLAMRYSDSATFHETNSFRD